MLAQRLGAFERDGVEDAVLFLAAGRAAGFELDPGEAEQAVERALLDVDVGDPVERDRAAGAADSKPLSIRISSRADPIFEA